MNQRQKGVLPGRNYRENKERRTLKYARRKGEEWGGSAPEFYSTKIFLISKNI
jgi:hypothetical protein